MSSQTTQRWASPWATAPLQSPPPSSPPASWLGDRGGGSSGCLRLLRAAAWGSTGLRYSRALPSEGRCGGGDSREGFAPPAAALPPRGPWGGPLTRGERNKKRRVRESVGSFPTSPPPASPAHSPTPHPSPGTGPGVGGLPRGPWALGRMVGECPGVFPLPPPQRPQGCLVTTHRPNAGALKMDGTKLRRSLYQAGLCW